MNDLPATRLQHVVVVNEQSGAVWRPGRARIRDGRIVIPGVRPPGGFFDNATATFRIEAFDGGNRVRRFANLVLVEHSNAEYIFD